MAYGSDAEYMLSFFLLRMQEESEMIRRPRKETLRVSVTSLKKKGKFKTA